MENKNYRLQDSTFKPLPVKPGLQHSQPTIQFEPLLNDAKAAALLGGLHVKTLQRMARTGRLPAHKIGRYWFFRISELDSWLQGNYNQVSQPVA